MKSRGRSPKSPSARSSARVVTPRASTRCRVCWIREAGDAPHVVVGRQSTGEPGCDAPRWAGDQDLLVAQHGPPGYRGILASGPGRCRAAANGGRFPPDPNCDREPHLVPRRRAERSVPRVLPGERRRDRAQRRDADVVDGDHRGLPAGLHPDVHRDRRVLRGGAGWLGHDGRPVRRVPLLQPVVRPIVRRSGPWRAGLRCRPADVRGWRGPTVPARPRRPEPPHQGARRGRRRADLRAGRP